MALVKSTDGHRECFGLKQELEIYLRRTQLPLGLFVMVVAVRLGAVGARLAEEGTDIREKVLKTICPNCLAQKQRSQKRRHIYRRLQTADFSRHQGVCEINLGTP